jgi:hypothetical protein
VEFEIADIKRKNLFHAIHPTAAPS